MNPEIYKHESHTAKVQHKCCECRGRIFPGEKYHKHFGVWEGEVAIYKICEDCTQLRELIDLDVSDVESLTPFTMVGESVLASKNADWLRRFVFTMVRRWVDVPQAYQQRLLEVGETIPVSANPKNLEQFRARYYPDTSFDGTCPACRVPLDNLEDRVGDETGIQCEHCKAALVARKVPAFEITLQ